MPADPRQDALQDAVLVQLLTLNARVQGLVAGLLAGLVIFIATNWLILKGGEVVGPHLALLGQFFIGYEISFFGSLIGFAYGFVTGYLAGYSAARLYNAISRWRGAAQTVPGRSADLGSTARRSPVAEP